MYFHLHLNLILHILHMVKESLITISFYRSRDFANDKKLFQKRKGYTISAYCEYVGKVY